MTCSNKQKSSLKLRNIMILLYSMSLVGLGCAERDSAKPSAATGASFLIDPKESVEVDFSPVDTPSENGYNYRKILSLKICLKDVAETKTIAKSEFKVLAGDIWSMKITDSYGCFMWKELIEFDPVDNDKTVFMSRRIEAVGKHVGGVDFEYSVNPSAPAKGKVVIYPDQKGMGETEKSNVIYQPQGVAKTAGKNYLYDVHVNIAQQAVSPGQKFPSGQSQQPASPGVYARRTSLSDLVLNYKQIDYSNIGVDRNLNLILPYSYFTEFSISFLKQNSTQLAEEKLKKGNFLFHLVFMKTLSAGKAPRSEDVYSVVRFTGQPRGDLGLIRQEITMNFENIPALSNRMSVFLTVTSQDSPVLFADQTFEGVVDGIAANKKLTITLNPSEISARTVYADFTSYKDAKQKSEINVAASLQGEGIWPVSSSRVSFKSSTKESVTVDLEKVVRDVQDIKSLSRVDLEAFCEVIFAEQANKDKVVTKMYNDCLRVPQGVLAAEIREYATSLKSIVGTPRFNALEKFTLTSKMNLDYLSESSVSTSRSEQASASGEVGLEFKNPDKNEGGLINRFMKWTVVRSIIGVAGRTAGGVASKVLEGLKYNFNGKLMAAAGYMAQTSNKSAQSEESNLEGLSTETLFAQQIAVDMDLEFKKCLVLSVNSSVEEKLVNSPFSSQRFFCVDGVREKRTESYYLVQQIKNTESNTIIDPYSSESNPVKIMIRGNRLYSNFMSLVKKKTVIGWVPVSVDSSKISSLMTEEAPLLLSSGRKILIPDSK